jgi:uncharacterized protein (UPF0332 family)
MTGEPSQDYVAKQLQLADEALDDAEFLLRDGRLKSAANRAYYAMFHSVQAALSSLGLRNPKTHSGTINLFSRHWVRSGKIDREFGGNLQDALDLRQQSDYNVYAVVGEQVISETVDQAKAFVAEVKRLIG